MHDILGVSSRHKSYTDLEFNYLKQLGVERFPEGNIWGVSIYANHYMRSFSDLRPAQSSLLLRSLLEMRLKAGLLMGSLSKPRYGKEVDFSALTLFSRECNGRTWSFVQQGRVGNVTDLHFSRFHPTGLNDAEKIFCRLMDGISNIYAGSGTSISLDDSSYVDQLAEEISILNHCGELNFILSDGESMYVHSHSRLFLRSFEEQVWVASCAGSSEWVALKPNTLLAFRHGQQIAQTQTRGRAPAGVWDRLAWDECDGRDCLSWKLPQESLSTGNDPELDPNCG